jgi:redox-sensitive bicupin YhaK (pirin superfamily)
LNGKKQFSLETENELEYAAFLPLNNVVINDEEYETGEFIAFDRQEGTIQINNDSNEAIDVILFGGEKYMEPIVFGGPFVMNSPDEISQAYKDFHEGKYGKINYSRN